MTIPTLRGPGELLATLPLLIGFTPIESVVVVSIRDGGEIGAVMRVDRDDCLVPDVAAPMSGAIAAHLAHDDAIAAILVSYTLDDVRLCCEAADVIRGAVAEVVQRVDSWAVSAGRYFAPGCADVTCCPVEGTQVPVVANPLETPPGGQVRASVSHSGARPGWGTAAAIQRRRCARAADRWGAKRGEDEETWRVRSLALWQRYTRRGGAEASALNEADLGKLVAAMSDVLVRDAVIVGLVPESDDAMTDVLAGVPSEAVRRALDSILEPHSGLVLDRQRADTLKGVLRQCLEHSRRKDAAPLLAMLALVQWWSGETPEALASCEAASASTPGYRLAGLLRATMLAGVVPGWRA